MTAHEPRPGEPLAQPALRRALEWLDENVREAPEAGRARRVALVDAAALRFDLSPPEVEFLLSRWVNAG